MVSTIGAGDGFNAGVIAEIMNSRFTKEQLSYKMEKLLEAGIAYSAIVCSSADNHISVKI